jgi:SnoaL-like protein
MPAYTRDEIEDAFARFQTAAKQAGSSGDWTEWGECFTDDAEYYEHHFGRLRGRKAIVDWITETMKQFPNDHMTEFPVDWYMVDEERGWVLMSVWNRMEDPGDGSVHQEYNWTLLHYGGNGQFSYEEDMYNPAEFGTMIKGWLKAKKALEAAPER